MFTQDLMIPRHLSQYAPRPPKIEELEDLHGRYGIKRSIPVLDYERYGAEIIDHEWDMMYRKLGEYIIRCLIGHTDYLTFKATPCVRQSEGWYVDFVLYVDIFVSQTSNVFIPEVQWGVQDDKPMEWRCGYCKSPNKMEDRHCTQCGSPRALLIQEMRI